MPSKEEAELWKKQLVENAEKKIIELTDSDQFKNYLTTLSKFHSYSINNINLNNGGLILTVKLIKAKKLLELQHQSLKSCQKKKR